MVILAKNRQSKPVLGIHNVIVVVQGNKIAALGQNVDIPKDAVLLDLSDKTVLPGLIDTHTHIMLDGGDDYGSNLYKNSMSFRAIQRERMIAAPAKGILMSRD